MTCPTVKIARDNDQGFIIINESDFDKDIHELYLEKSKEPKEGTKDWYKAKLDEMEIEYTDIQKKDELKGIYDLAIESSENEETSED